MSDPDTHLVSLIGTSIAGDPSLIPTASLEDRLRATMTIAKDHWLTDNEQARFKGAIAAVMLRASPEEKERISNELRVLGVLGGLSAATEGLPIDMGALISSDGPEPIGLLRIWHEVKGAHTRHCTDCGWSGTDEDFHSCPGRPGENKW